jgi:hypothetical protein
MNASAAFFVLRARREAKDDLRRRRKGRRKNEELGRRARKDEGKIKN